MRQEKQKKYGAAYGRPFVRLAVLAVISLAMRSGLQGALTGTVNLPLGSVSGIGGDAAFSSPLAGITCRLTGNVFDGKIQCLLDLKSAKTLDAILLMNATNGASNLNADRAAIRVAPDEHASGFDHTDVASYTMLVYSNSFLPRANTMSLSRQAILNQRLKRRYYLIQHTHNMWGAVEVGESTNQKEIRFQDVSYRLAPPSGTVILVR